MRIPKGWRRLRKGAVVRKGDKYWSDRGQCWLYTNRWNKPWPEFLRTTSGFDLKDEIIRKIITKKRK